MRLRLCKKSRTFTKVTSPPVIYSNISVKTSDACAQHTGCALLTTSPDDVTNTSLDTSTSFRLSEDTARNVSHSTATGEKLNDHCTSETEGITVKAHVHKDFLSQSSESSTKWARRSAVVNKKQRIKYWLNPKGKQLSSSKYYYSQPILRSQQVLRAYHLNPSPMKKRMLDAYHKNPSPIKKEHWMLTMRIHDKQRVRVGVCTMQIHS